jgi:hypothetical protein
MRALAPACAIYDSSSGSSSFPAASTSSSSSIIAAAHAAFAPTRGRGATARTRAAPAGAVGAPAAAEEQLAAVAQLTSWLTSSKGMAPPLLEPKRFKAAARSAEERVGFIAARDTPAGAALLALPEAVAITAIDAEKHPLVGEAAKDCGEMVALALWLLAERAAVAAGGASAYAPLLAALPQATDTPILWDDKERADLLRVRRGVDGAAGAR